MAKKMTVWLLALITLTAGHAKGQEKSISLTSASHSSAPQSEQVDMHGATTRYVIKRGDTVSISFDLATELNQNYLIEPDGYINLRNASPIHAEGKTVAQLNAAVKQAYASILSDSSIITVDVSNFQKPYFTVTGQQLQSLEGFCQRQRRRSCFFIRSRIGGSVLKSSICRTCWTASGLI